MERPRINLKDKLKPWLPLKIILAIGVLYYAAFAESSKIKPDPSEESPPSLAELNTALALANDYVDKLFKEIDPENSTMAEYEAFPLAASLPGNDRLILAGEDEGVFCLGPICQKTTSLEAISSGKNSEAFTIQFSSPNTTIYQMDTGIIIPGLLDEPLVMDVSSPISTYDQLVGVRILWNLDEDFYGVVLSNSASNITDATAQIYLADREVANFGEYNIGESILLVLPEDDSLQSWRYTQRHGTQVGIGYYNYLYSVTHDPRYLERVQTLRNFLTASGYVEGFDIHSPIWGYGENLPDDMVYNQSLVYADCDLVAPQITDAYSYESKVCLAEERYTQLTPYDTLVPAAQALQMLYKYGQPYGNLQTQQANIPAPVDTAKSLEEKFDDLAFGMPLCLLDICKTDTANGIRTAHFAVLATILGYGYQIPGSQEYADRAIRLILDSQIDSSGQISTPSGILYRPAHIGGFLVSWDRNGYFVSNPILGPLERAINMPSEYPGSIPSNVETTLDAIAALIHARCYMYGVGCSDTLSLPLN